MKKDSFILYKSFYEPLKMLSEKQLGKLFKAIFEYQISGKTEVDLDIQMAFAFIKNQLDIDYGKYEEKVKKNSDNGRKGGRPPKTDKQEEKADAKNKSQKSEHQNDKAKKAYNDNEYDNDNENDNENENVDDLNSNSNELQCETSQPHAETINYRSLVDFFNSETKGVFGTIQQNLSDKRKSMIRARIREHGKKMFEQAIKKASRSDYLKSGKFNCTFDWIIKPTNFEKILSGNYDNKNRTSNQGAGLDEDFTRNVLEGYARGIFEKQQG